MKYLVLTVVIFIYVFLFSCRKELPQTINTRNGHELRGEANINMNGNLYKFKTYMKEYKSPDLYTIVFTYYENEIQRYQLSMKIFDLFNQKQIIFPRNDSTISRYVTSSMGAFVGDGDALDSYFNVNSTDSVLDYLKINNISLDSQYIKGEYQISYFKDTLTDFNSIAPDRLVVKCDYFKAYW